MSKYKLIDDKASGHYRIVATRTFETRMGIVKEGELGGLVSSPDVLSHEGRCWIAEGARAVLTSQVIEDALVVGKGALRDSVISGYVIVRDNAVVEKSTLSNYAVVHENAYVNCSSIRESVVVGGGASVYDSTLCGGVAVGGGTVYRSKLSGYFIMGGGMCVDGCTLFNRDDAVWMPVNYNNTTLTKENVCCGCFCGTPHAFYLAVTKKYGMDFGPYAAHIAVLVVKGWLDKEAAEKEALLRDSIKVESEYWLEPRFSSHKSFYKKAKVIERSSGQLELRSYNTIIALVTPEKELRILFSALTATSKRHLKEFMQQQGFTLYTTKELSTHYEDIQHDDSV